MLLGIWQDIVAAGLAREVLIQLAYVIGEAKPVSIYVERLELAK